MYVAYVLIHKIAILKVISSRKDIKILNISQYQYIAYIISDCKVANT